MVPEGDRPRTDRRRDPRYPARLRVEGASPDGRLETRGILRDLSAGGCLLHLDRHIPPGTAIKVRCDISGIRLAICGTVVWSEAAAGGVLHGVVVTGFASEQDALFHRLYVGRLARLGRGDELPLAPRRLPGTG
jgi:hypothetical protein